MLRQVVDSTSLRSIGYDRASRTLEVEFSNGSIYRYAEVPEATWHELRHAPSKGQYFQAHVRDSYPTQRA